MSTFSNHLTPASRSQLHLNLALIALAALSACGGGSGVDAQSATGAAATDMATTSETPEMTAERFRRRATTLTTAATSVSTAKPATTTTTTTTTTPPVTVTTAAPVTPMDAPKVTLNNLPTNRTLSTSASISYETASSGSVYCRLDSYVPIACPNPFVLGTTAEQALSAGTHTVDYYVDSGSGFDLSNPTSSYSWVVEAAATTPTTTAPAETIPAVTTPVATAPAVTTPAATTPSTAQIPTLGSISAAQSFSAMNGYVQRLGGSSSLSATPESSGITASGSIAGSTMRFGKIADPLNPARQVLRFAGAASDPLTYGHSRVEAGFSTGTASIVPDTTYWIACELNIPASRLTNGGSGNVMQVHQSDSAVDVFGPFALVVYNPGGVSVVYRYASNPSSPQGSVLWSDTKYPTDTWQKWVFKFRTNYSGANGSFLQAWQNGVKRVDYSGPIGINTPGYNDYVKFGWDDWSGQGGGAGTYNLVRSCHLVKDAGYSLDQVSALLN